MKAQPVIPFNHRLRQHPDFRRLLADPDCYWRPMMASVARPLTVAGECARLHEAAEQTDKEVHGLRNEVGELRRTLAGLQAQRAGNDGSAPPPDGHSKTSAPQIQGRVIA